MQEDNADKGKGDKALPEQEGIMKQINERIEWLEEAIKTLSNWKPKTHIDEINRIINLAEYKEEIEKLKEIKKANASLFR